MRSLSFAVLLLVGGVVGASSCSADVSPRTQTVAIERVVVMNSIVSASNTLAQSSYESESSGGSTRVRTRGIGKLIGLVVVGLLAAGKFIFGMFTGGGGSDE